MHAQRREHMVRSQIAARGIRAPAVLDAMRAVPRHRFVPDELVGEAYADTPLPIGYGQTISQPYIVALMTELVRPGPGKRALDVGTGSGYQAAVLAEIADHVDSIDIVCPLADAARERLRGLGYTNVTIRCGDGWSGWPDGGRYDVIVVAAAPAEIPPPLLEQLAVGGRLVIPLGVGVQDLVMVERRADGTLEHTDITAVRFVPMTGRARERDRLDD
ncbi:MAG: protein-L-isoaspartate(D-aspartate) O-methyltransferase [Deltaproteobacteria bacterium]|nr:MAG: protein-L-isoaspartate(D-aspartate) O-methyltransferase [Deltaproteobacteria bacterium]